MEPNQNLLLLGVDGASKAFSGSLLTNLWRNNAKNPKNWQRWHPHLLHPGATNLPDHFLELCDLVKAIPATALREYVVYICINETQDVPGTSAAAFQSQNIRDECAPVKRSFVGFDLVKYRKWVEKTQNNPIKLHFNRDYCTMMWTRLAFKSLTLVPARICSDSWSSRTEIFISLTVGVARPNRKNHLWRRS